MPFAVSIRNNMRRNKTSLRPDFPAGTLVVPNVSSTCGDTHETAAFVVVVVVVVSSVAGSLGRVGPPPRVRPDFEIGGAGLRGAHLRSRETPLIAITRLWQINCAK